MYLIAADHYKLGIALDEQGKKDEALIHLESAVDIFQRLNSPKVKEAREILDTLER